MEPLAVTFIVVMMIIGGIKWLLENLSGNRNHQEDQAEASFADLYEEARQQILERQARQHTQQEAPQPFAQQRIIEPGTPPPLVPAPPPLPILRRPLVAQHLPPRSAPPKPLQGPVIKTAEIAILEPPQERENNLRSPRRSTRTSVLQLLASPTSTRDAIVLLEILGPPKGAI